MTPPPPKLLSTHLHSVGEPVQIGDAGLVAALDGRHRKEAHEWHLDVVTAGWRGGLGNRNIVGAAARPAATAHRLLWRAQPGCMLANVPDSHLAVVAAAHNDVGRCRTKLNGKHVLWCLQDNLCAEGGLEQAAEIKDKTYTHLRVDGVLEGPDDGN